MWLDILLVFNPKLLWLWLPPVCAFIVFLILLMQWLSLHRRDGLSSKAEKSQFGVNQVHKNMKCIMYKIPCLPSFYFMDPQCAIEKIFVVMFGISLTQLINPAQHIQSGLANLKCTLTQIQQMSILQVKMILVSFTKTFLTSLLLSLIIIIIILVDLPCNNNRSYIPLTKNPQ